MSDDLLAELASASRVRRPDAVRLRVGIEARHQLGDVDLGMPVEVSSDLDSHLWQMVNDRVGVAFADGLAGRGRPMLTEIQALIDSFDFPVRTVARIRMGRAVFRRLTQVAVQPGSIGFRSLDALFGLPIDQPEGMDPETWEAVDSADRVLDSGRITP